MLAVLGRRLPQPVPERSELGDLLVEGERGEERCRSAGCVERGVVPGAHGCSFVGGGHPLTAPESPPTIRRCIARNKIIAGIMARLVNAKTPAVSAECSDE